MCHRSRVIRVSFCIIHLCFRVRPTVDAIHFDLHQHGRKNRAHVTWFFSNPLNFTSIPAKPIVICRRSGPGASARGVQIESEAVGGASCIKNTLHSIRKIGANRRKLPESPLDAAADSLYPLAFSRDGRSTGTQSVPVDTIQQDRPWPVPFRVGPVAGRRRGETGKMCSEYQLVEGEVLNGRNRQIWVKNEQGK